MRNDNRKKRKEMDYASFFISQINSQNNWDYVAIPNEDEQRNDGDVDVYARSKNFNTLNLQLKIIDKDYKKNEISRERKPLVIQIRNIDSVKWAKETIRESALGYSPGVRCDMILLLCLYHATPLDKQYAKREFQEFEKSDFKAIYLIIPPLCSNNNKGDITTIKSL